MKRWSLTNELDLEPTRAKSLQILWAFCSLVSPYMDNRARSFLVPLRSKRVWADYQAGRPSERESWKSSRVQFSVTVFAVLTFLFVVNQFSSAANPEVVCSRELWWFEVLINIWSARKKNSRVLVGLSRVRNQFAIFCRKVFTANSSRGLS